MTKKEASTFRRVLEATVVELHGATRQRDAIAIENSADQIERLTHAGERELAVRTLELNSAKLRKTSAALRRIQEGTFGTCLECDEEISPRRLAAMPWAALCIGCQEQADLRDVARNVQPTLALAA